MKTNVDEIGPDIFRFSTFIPDVGPTGFTFNQFLVRAEQPFLFHTGMRGCSRSCPTRSRAWCRSTSCAGSASPTSKRTSSAAMNQFLAAAPDAQVVHSTLACMVSLNDLADRPPHPVQDGDVLDLGGKRMRFLATPHVPHNWESGLWFEETTNTLFSGDRHDDARRRPRDHLRRSRGAGRHGGERLPADVARPAGRVHDAPARGVATGRRWRSCTGRRSRATAAPRCSRSPTSTTRSPPSRRRPERTATACHVHR